MFSHPSLLFLLPALLCGAYFLFKRELGQRLARRELVRLGLFVAILFIGRELYYQLADHSSYQTTLVFAAVAIVMGRLGSQLYYESRAGKVLYEILNANDNIAVGAVSTAITCSLTCHAFNKALHWDTPHHTWLCMGLLFAAILLYVAWSCYAGVNVREKGIRHYGRFIVWHRIKSIEWPGEHPKAIVLHLRGALPFFNTLTLSVPRWRRDEIIRILNQYWQQDARVQAMRNR